MVEEIQKFTKLTFLIHLILGSIVTIMYFMPEVTFASLGVTYSQEAGAVTMILACAVLGLTVSSLCGLMAKEWKELKIVVINEIVWLTAAIIVTIINISILGAGTAIMIVMQIVLVALFLLTFLQQEEKIKELLK
jgi:hypothetical protein